MKIGIVGAGQIGGTLTRRLAQLGNEVFVANSRGPSSLAGLAKWEFTIDDGTNILRRGGSISGAGFAIEVIDLLANRLTRSGLWRCQ